MRKAAYILLSIIGVLLPLIVGLFGALQTGMARDRMRTLLADLTAGTSTQVQVDAIEGLLPFDVHLVGLRLSDRNGVWATADRIDLAWSPLALASGRLQVDQIVAGTIDLARAPAAQEPPQPEPHGPLIPELPVAIDLRSLSVERVALAAPILGQPASLSLQASAELAELGDDLSASLAVQQLSGNTGTATIDLSYRQNEDFLRLAGKVDEPRGGILGRLLGLPQGSNLQVALYGEGPLKDWHGRMSADLNNKTLVELTGDVRGEEARTIAFTLRTAPDDLLPEKLRPLIAGGIDATGTFAIRPGGKAVDISAFSARTAAGEVNASGLVGLKEPGDVSLTIALDDSRPFATLVPDVAWSGATVKARVQGVVERPHVTGDIAVRSLAAADQRIGAMKLDVEASAEQGFEQPIGVRADLQMSDLALDDPRLTTLVADGVRLNVTGSLDRTGTVVADK